MRVVFGDTRFKPVFACKELQGAPVSLWLVKCRSRPHDPACWNCSPQTPTFKPTQQLLGLLNTWGATKFSCRGKTGASPSAFLVLKAVSPEPFLVWMTSPFFPSSPGKTSKGEHPHKCASTAGLWNNTGGFYVHICRDKDVNNPMFLVIYKGP